MSEKKRMTRSEFKREYFQNIGIFERADQGELDRAIDRAIADGAIPVDPDPPQKTVAEFTAEQMIFVDDSLGELPHQVMLRRCDLIGFSLIVFKSDDRNDAKMQASNIRNSIVPWLDRIIAESEAAGAAKYLANAMAEETPARIAIRRDALAEGRLEGAKAENERLRKAWEHGGCEFLRMIGHSR
jgi:hypothetical protein